MFRLTKKIKQSFEMALRFVPDHLKKEHDILRHLDNEGLEGGMGSIVYPCILAGNTLMHDRP